MHNKQRKNVGSDPFCIF